MLLLDNTITVPDINELRIVDVLEDRLDVRNPDFDKIRALVIEVATVADGVDTHGYRIRVRNGLSDVLRRNVPRSTNPMDKLTILEDGASTPGAIETVWNAWHSGRGRVNATLGVLRNLEIIHPSLDGTFR